MLGLPMNIVDLSPSFGNMIIVSGTRQCYKETNAIYPESNCFGGISSTKKGQVMVIQG